MPAADPMLARRARIARWVSFGKRLGYGATLAALVLFVVAFLSDFSRWQSNAILALLAVACVALPPAIVFGYGLRAAEREEGSAPGAALDEPERAATDE